MQSIQYYQQDQRSAVQCNSLEMWDPRTASFIIGIAACGYSKH